MADTKENTDHLRKEIQHLESLFDSLSAKEALPEKLSLLNQDARVQAFLPRIASFGIDFSRLTQEEAFVVKALLAIGQGPYVFVALHQLASIEQQFSKLLITLLETEQFYGAIGGIIGYHLTVLRCIVAGEEGQVKSSDKVEYCPPIGIDLATEQAQKRTFVRKGIEQLPMMGELYPVGGAGDRLKLVDEKTGEPLPAAVLVFQGKSLLEHLVEDLQAREYLYYKLFKKQITTPIAMMTSYEKNNHLHITSICEEAGWFGRPQESFNFFVQRCVPVISVNGRWLMEMPMEPILKPGGHGVIWKEAQDKGVFEWFKKHDRKKLLIRQINNPIAGTDDALLAFTGLGCLYDKAFGFASCKRLVNSAEGVNVFCVKESAEGCQCSITNIEYTEFTKNGIKDVGVSPDNEYSEYPANTNILFADIAEVQHAIKQCSIPGMIINMKSIFKSLQESGEYHEIQGGRLESTMQNIADVIVDVLPSKISSNADVPLKTFLTDNIRRKTISVTKCSYEEGGAIAGTPPGCYYEVLQNYYELLHDQCKMSLPNIPTIAEYLHEGPSFVVSLHPAMGPSWEIICQKIRGGILAPNAELQLDIAEVDLENIHIEGSLLIEANNSIGKMNSNGLLEYSSYCGKCTMKNVTIKNKGIRKEAENIFWQGKIIRDEALRIVIHGNGEFFAESVVFNGDQYIEVPEGCRLVAYMIGDEVSYRKEYIKTFTWEWKYSFGKNDEIVLTKSS